MSTTIHFLCFISPVYCTLYETGASSSFLIKIGRASNFFSETLNRKPTSLPLSTHSIAGFFFKWIFEVKSVVWSELKVSEDDSAARSASQSLQSLMTPSPIFTQLRNRPRLGPTLTKFVIQHSWVNNSWESRWISSETNSCFSTPAFSEGPGNHVLVFGWPGTSPAGCGLLRSDLCSSGMSTRKCEYRLQSLPNLPLNETSSYNLPSPSVSSLRPSVPIYSQNNCGEESLVSGLKLSRRSLWSFKAAARSKRLCIIRKTRSWKRWDIDAKRSKERVGKPERSWIRIYCISVICTLLVDFDNKPHSVVSIN